VEISLIKNSEVFDNKKRKKKSLMTKREEDDDLAGDPR